MPCSPRLRWGRSRRKRFAAGCRVPMWRSPRPGPVPSPAMTGSALHVRPARKVPPHCGGVLLNEQALRPRIRGGDAVSDGCLEQRSRSPQRRSDLALNLPTQPGGATANTEQNHAKELERRIVLTGNTSRCTIRVMPLRLAASPRVGITSHLAAPSASSCSVASPGGQSMTTKSYSAAPSS